MLVIADTVNYISERIEVGFNIAGSVPVFGVLSNIARLSAAKVQMVVGLVFTASGVFAFGFAKLSDDEEASEEAKEFINFGVEYICHGFMNSFRSCAEIASQVLTLGVATILFNCSGESGEEFEAVVKYRRYDFAGNLNYIFA